MKKAFVALLAVVFALALLPLLSATSLQSRRMMDDKIPKPKSFPVVFPRRTWGQNYVPSKGGAISSKLQIERFTFIAKTRIIYDEFVSAVLYPTGYLTERLIERFDLYKAGQDYQGIKGFMELAELEAEVPPDNLYRINDIEVMSEDYHLCDITGESSCLLLTQYREDTFPEHAQQQMIKLYSDPRFSIIHLQLMHKSCTLASFAMCMFWTTNEFPSTPCLESHGLRKDIEQVVDFVKAGYEPLVINHETEDGLDFDTMQQYLALYGPGIIDAANSAHALLLDGFWKDENEKIAGAFVRDPYNGLAFAIPKLRLQHTIKFKSVLWRGKKLVLPPHLELTGSVTLEKESSGSRVVLATRDKVKDGEKASKKKPRSTKDLLQVPEIEKVDDVEEPFLKKKEKDDVVSGGVSSEKIGSSEEQPLLLPEQQHPGVRLGHRRTPALTEQQWDVILQRNRFGRTRGHRRTNAMTQEEWETILGPLMETHNLTPKDWEELQKKEK